MIDLEPFAPIEVTAHARRRIRERLAPDVEDGEIRHEIRVAILAGRVSDTVPNWTRGTGEPGEAGIGVYVWDAAAIRCWVVTSNRETIYVKTVLLERQARNEAAQLRLLRPGTQRA